MLLTGPPSPLPRVPRNAPGSVPDQGARPSGDETAAAACHATGCGPVPDLGHPRNPEARSEREMSRSVRSCHVSAAHRAVRTRCLGWSHRDLPGRGWGSKVGTTASCVAPGSDGLVENGRAPSSGTAARATREVGSAPNPATDPGRGLRRTGRNTTAAWTGGRAPGGPSRERRAHRSPPNQTDPGGERHDPNQRVSIAVATTMDTRYRGSRKARSHVAGAHCCRHSNGQPTLRIMRRDHHRKRRRT
jgi:hypothetical protein